MGEKQKKKVKAREDLEFKKEKKKAQKKFNAEMDKLSKSNFEDFRKGVIKQLKDSEEMFYTMYDLTCGVAQIDGEQRDMMLKEIGKAHKNIKKSFKDVAKDIGTVDKRVHMLEGFMLLLADKVMSHIENEPMGYEWKKGIASLLSIDWDGTVKELMRSPLWKKEAPETEPSSAIPGA